MQRRDWGELANRMDLIELLTGSPSLPDKEDERSESSLFRDAEAFLNNAQRFLFPNRRSRERAQSGSLPSPAANGCGRADQGRCTLAA